VQTEDSLVAETWEALEPLMGAEGAPLEPTLLETEQSNTLIAYGHRLLLKCFRRLTPGVPPELEIGRFLTAHRRFPHTPPVVGALEYRPPGRGEPMTLAVLQGYVPHHENAWQYTLAALGSYFTRARTASAAGGELALTAAALLDRAVQDAPPLAQELIGPYLGFARRLGQQTAELHQALAAAPEEALFAPEPFSPLDQRALYQSMRGLTLRVWRRLGEHWKRLPAAARGEAQALLDSQDAVLQRFQAVLEGTLTARRMRCHGDYDLRQVLCTDGDVTLIDFAGVPARLLEERQLKRCPLYDVAGMLRSFHYAAYAMRWHQAVPPRTAPAQLPRGSSTGPASGAPGSARGSCGPIWHWRPRWRACPRRARS
jgi:maltose alpha-D-glucosyltransferase / alpha-amylase